MAIKKTKIDSKVKEVMDLKDENRRLRQALERRDEQIKLFESRIETQEQWISSLERKSRMNEFETNRLVDIIRWQINPETAVVNDDCRTNHDRF
jgi:chromosome segregation ATPase